MPQFQILKNGTPHLVQRQGGGQELAMFDDNQLAMPGEEGYSAAAVEAHVASLGAGFAFALAGPSPVQRQQAVELAIAQEAAAAAELARAQEAADARAAADAEAAKEAQAAALRAQVTGEKLRRSDPLEWERQNAVRAIYDQYAEKIKMAQDCCNDLVPDLEALRAADLEAVEIQADAAKLQRAQNELVAAERAAGPGPVVAPIEEEVGP